VIVRSVARRLEAAFEVREKGETMRFTKLLAAAALLAGAVAVSTAHAQTDDCSDNCDLKCYPTEAGSQLTTSGRGCVGYPGRATACGDAMADGGPKGCVCVAGACVNDMGSTPVQTGCPKTVPCD
jgi:hypothetical protein